MTGREQMSRGDTRIEIRGGAVAGVRTASGLEALRCTVDKSVTHHNSA